MNSTNRFLNRLFVFVAGLVVLAAGAAVSVGALLPDAQSTISDGAESAVGPATDALDAQPWILWVAAVAAVLLIVSLLWFVFRQGRGHTGTLLRIDEASSRKAPSGGGVTLDVKVAAQVLEEAITRNPDVVSVDVAGFRVKNENTLRLTAHARRGASPVELRRSIDAAVAEWDAVLGTSTPIVIQIVSGLRTKFAGTNRVA
ncbi:hypothetical protein [Labedella endophytica]|uniref:Alkaline shock response membrane anchor protein AmaP n=1 Tax=Labedella endophytica TaxID=1523160 RepID=A0A3S0VVJ5_9MICO|nr:hypothetical protein [Labedella endophytica]RUR03074.1 hypothetical protein ELQ94_00505 [Labedella endophytica]